MAKFKNPNEPEQPKAGVYRWFVIKNKQPFFTLYIGCAGLKDTFFSKGTLFRGVSELQRSPFSSDKGKSLDTDFIVGTSIFCIEGKLNFECWWEHISDDPNDERCMCKKYLPILQDSNCRIKQKYKSPSGHNKWNLDKLTKSEKGLLIKEAEQSILNNLISEIKSIRPNIA